MTLSWGKGIIFVKISLIFLRVSLFGKYISTLGQKLFFMSGTCRISGGYIGEGMSTYLLREGRYFDPKIAGLGNAYRTVPLSRTQYEVSMEQDLCRRYGDCCLISSPLKFIVDGARFYVTYGRMEKLCYKMHLLATPYDPVTDDSMFHDDG